MKIILLNPPFADYGGKPAEEILSWQKKAYRQYYLSLRYILNKITSIKGIVDFKNIYNGAKLFLKLEK